MTRKRLAFLNLDRERHHTPHLLPIALACSRVPDWECVLYTQDISMEVVNAITPLYPDHALRIEVPPPSPLKTLVPRKRGIGASHFMKRLAKELGTYDALITPDTNLQPFLDAHTGPKPKLVYSFHGSGDRGYPFETDVSYVDFFLLPGEKFAARRRELGQLKEGNWAVIGYPKLEVMEKQIQQALFPNNNPTVFYNPHHDRDASSWFHWGHTILDFFLERAQSYNLVFAPHILIKPKLPKRFLDAPNILVDLGSPALVDGTYVVNSDVYLGDLSSQIYEFIYKPRPALFLNPTKMRVPGNPNLAFWNLGWVVDTVENLDPWLNEAVQDNPYGDLQVEAVKKTFSQSDQSPGKRAVEALETLL